MATDLANLITRRNNITAELAALTSSAAGGLPNAGKSGIDHVGYKDGLYRELETINRLIASADDGGAGGAWETIIEGVP